MTTLPTDTPPEPDHAEAWLARLQAPDCSVAEREAFERWRSASPARSDAWAQVVRIHRRSAELAGDPLLRAAARGARRQGARAAGRRRLRWALPVAVAAMLLLAAIAWRVAVEPTPVQHYATGVGEQRTLYLSDGSAVLLDTDSAVSVRYGASRRDVTLDRGRAQFQVIHEALRPFLVHACDGVIRDIGTRFQVRRQARDVSVTLLDGTVSVSLPANGEHSTLVPGQQISYGNGRLGTARPADLRVANGWTHGDLIFRNRRLAELVVEMNRYSNTKLRLGDAVLDGMPVSGVFHAGDQLSLAQALHSGWSLRVEQVSPREIVLLPPRR